MYIFGYRNKILFAFALFVGPSISFVSLLVFAIRRNLAVKSLINCVANFRL